MKNNIKTLIKVANLQNSKLKTVIKARNKLKSLIEDALTDIKSLVKINVKINITRDILDNPEFDELCDSSKMLYDKIKLMDIFKNIDQLTDLLDNSDKELAELADDLIDTIDENKEHIVAKPNPLKGYKSNPIPL